MVKIGIIGGSGLDNPDLLYEPRDIELDTPFGRPSSLIKAGFVSDVAVCLLARHGREHTIPPGRVNYRANIHALKEIGCTHILATTAVGSLKEEIGRGHFIILDQFLDFTKGRVSSFYDKFPPHKPIHASLADPFSRELREILIKTAEDQGLIFHPAGTVVTIEGPRFSTRPESKMWRLLGADVINMSIATEAALAAEAGVPYAAIAMSTDYDCWKEGEAPVSWEEVLAVFSGNVEKVTGLLVSAIPRIRG